MSAATTDRMRSQIRGAVGAFRRGDATRFDFIDAMISIISLAYRRAWLEGASECGVNSLDELTDQEINALQDAINEDSLHIFNFAVAIEQNATDGGLLRDLFSRIELWVNRFNAVKAQAQTMSCANQKFIWLLGPTEKHCKSCAGFDRRVYRGSVWAANNAKPQAQTLACNGFRCLCDLRPTSDKVTPGRFPAGLLG